MQFLATEKAGANNLEGDFMTEEAAKLAELCAGWYEGRTGEEMAACIAAEIRNRIAPPVNVV